LLNKEKESNERIISLESENERLKSDAEKLREEIVCDDETIFTEKSRNESLAASLRTAERDLT
jgi:hypothetical protein